MELPPDIASASAESQAHYKKMIADGQSPRFAAMCALRIAPGTKGSDRAFLEGRQNNQQLDAMPKLQAQYLVREAKQAGINPSGKYYCAGIADRRGWRDPAAWVTSGDDVLRVAKKRRMAVSGSVNYDPGPAPPERKVLSESIIRDEMRRELKANPAANKRELREKIIDKRAYKVKGRT
jgi:hypothetical protein